jgi:hypothetical protein
MAKANGRTPRSISDEAELLLVSAANIHSIVERVAPGMVLLDKRQFVAAAQAMLVLTESAAMRYGDLKRVTVIEFNEPEQLSQFMSAAVAMCGLVEEAARRDGGEEGRETSWIPQSRS